MNIEFEIKDIKHDLNYAKKCEYDHVTLNVYKVQALLTAYEKEKEKNKELSDKLTQKICKGVEEEILEEYRQTIISKDKEIEELKEVKWYYEISRVPKDKIKAKIEELNNKLKNADEIEVIFIIKQQQVLQSLLEKGRYKYRLFYKN